MDLITSSFFLTFQLGIPVALLAWYLFSRLYDRGHLDDQADPKEALKALKARNKEDKIEDPNLIQQRWMKFGGGFYGLTALWTFVVIEVVGFVQFIIGFPGFSALFADGVIAFFVGVLVNQLKNLIAAFIWFTYWNEAIVTVAVSYVGYLLGMNVAKLGYRFNKTTNSINRPDQVD